MDFPNQFDDEFRQFVGRISNIDAGKIVMLRPRAFQRTDNPDEFDLTFRFAVIPDSDEPVIISEKLE